MKIIAIWTCVLILGSAGCLMADDSLNQIKADQTTAISGGVKSEAASGGIIGGGINRVNARRITSLSGGVKSEAAPAAAAGRVPLRA